MENSVNDAIIWKINSQLNQVIIIPRHFEYVLTNRTVLLHLAVIELVGDFISQLEHLLDILTSTPGTSHMVHDVQNIFEALILSRKAWCTKLSSSHHIELAKRS